MTVFIIVAVNIIISPSFWLNLWVGADDQGLSSNPNMAFAVFGCVVGVGDNLIIF